MLSKFGERFGRLVWSQVRDMQVYNYEKYIVYEIYESGGYRHVAIEKSTDKVEWIQPSPTYQKPYISLAKCNLTKPLKDL